MTEPAQQESENLGHEPIAADTRAIAITAAGLVGLMFISLILMAGLMAWFSYLSPESPTAEATSTAVELPPGVPPLEADLEAELKELRKQEYALLTQYAWVDRDLDVVRIPIRRAMQIVAQSPPTPSSSTNRNTPDKTQNATNTQ